jgi:hypothetical protein
MERPFRDGTVRCYRPPCIGRSFRYIGAIHALRRDDGNVVGGEAGRYAQRESRDAGSCRGVERRSVKAAGTPGDLRAGKGCEFGDRRPLFDRPQLVE